MKYIILIIFVFLMFYPSASEAHALQKNPKIKSQGTISYMISRNVTEIPPTTKGELYMWIGFWMSPMESRTQRIANARDTYGITIWVDAGNWDSEHLTSELINYLHAHGVKVVARLHSLFGQTPINTLLHSMDPTDFNGGVDYQLSIGSEIDAFMIDEVNQSDIEYYQSVIDYVHSKGKLCFGNPGTHLLSDQIVNMFDKVSVEWQGYAFVNSATGQAQIEANPQKFISDSDDWGYACGDSVYMPPKSASENRPEYSFTLNKERAVWDTVTLWNKGVYCMEARPGDTHGNGGLIPSTSTFPDWWENYIADIVAST